MYIDHYPNGDSRTGGIYMNAEFYEVRNDGNYIVAYIIREKTETGKWVLRKAVDETILDRDKYRHDLIDRLRATLKENDLV